MLCPEVWNFKAPESTFKCEKGNFGESDCLKEINRFYYSHLVSVIFPDTLSAPSSLADVLIDDCEYYKVSNLSISELIDISFIDSFVKKGNLWVFSVPNRIDCEDCIAITPNKSITLSLTKETYQCLGLEGKLSQFSCKTKSRYIVKLDLTLDFKPGKKNYERIRTCFKNLKHFDVILNWEPPEPDVCPSSVAKYFDNLNYDIKLSKPKYNSHTSRSVRVPAIDFDSVDFDFVEWLGMISLNADLDNGSPDSFITTYEPPEPNCVVDRVSYLEWKGFFTSCQVHKLLLELRKLVSLENKPWVSLYIQGFSDSPINFSEREHHYYANGDTSYTIIMNSKNYVLCTQNCSFKYYNKK